MKSSMALVASLAAVLVAAFMLPTPAAFAATIEADIVPGALNKTDDAYSPNPIEINAGDTVIWTNKDTTLHTVSSGTASEPTHIFGDEPNGQPKYLGPNAEIEVTFNEEGEYPYYCTLHPLMVGTVIVGAGAGNGNGEEPVESTATAEHDGQTYTITALSAETSLTSAEIVPGESVRLQFDGPGEVDLILPTGMISSIDEAQTTVQFERVDESADFMTISFTVPESGEVEISGAVVPEFGVIAALVLAVSLVAVIGVARFKGSSFGLGRF